LFNSVVESTPSGDRFLQDATDQKILKGLFLRIILPPHHSGVLTMGSTTTEEAQCCQELWLKEHMALDTIRTPSSTRQIRGAHPCKKTQGWAEKLSARAWKLWVYCRRVWSWFRPTPL